MEEEEGYNIFQAEQLADRLMFDDLSTAANYHATTDHTAHDYGSWLGLLLAVVLIMAFVFSDQVPRAR